MIDMNQIDNELLRVFLKCKLHFTFYIKFVLHLYHTFSE